MRLPPFAFIPDDDSALACERWQWIRDGIAEPLQDSLPGWEYRSNLQLRRTVRFDPERISELTGLGPGSELRMLAEWSSSVSTRKQAGKFSSGHSSPSSVKLDGGKQQHQLEFIVPGNRIGSRIELRTVVVLGRAVAAEPGAPTRPGSVIWSDVAETWLEGVGERLPVALVSFSKHRQQFRNNRAKWSVRFEPDALNRPVSAAMLVYLNADTSARMLAESADGELHRTVRSMLLYDVARSMIDYALADPEFTDIEHKYGEGTLGSSLRLNLSTLFSGRPLTEIQGLKKTQPHILVDQIQGEFGLLEAR